MTAEVTSSLLSTNRRINEIIINDIYTRSVYSEDDMVNNQPVINISKIQTKDFIEKFTNLGNYSDILPKNCRYISADVNRTLCIIEHPPTLRTIKLNISLEAEIEFLRTKGLLEKFGYEDFLKNNKPPYKMQLSFPYIIYIIAFDSFKSFRTMNIFYRLHPLTSLEDYLLCTNLLNVGEGGLVCLGDKVGYKQDQNISEKVDAIINTFWANEFNSDITTSYLMYAYQSQISTYLAWKYYSKVDPMFIFDIEWNSYMYNLKDYIKFEIRNEKNSNASQIDLMNRYISKEHQFINKKEVTIYRNSSESIALHNSKSKAEYLVVGDEIFLDDKKYYVYELIFIDNSCFVSLEDEEGNIIKKELTTEFKDELRDSVKKNKTIKYIEINGEKLTEGTILQTSTGSKKLKIIQKIKKSRDGSVEIRCGNDFFFVNDNILNGFKIFNKDNLTFGDDVKAIVGNKYLINYQSTTPISVFQIATLQNFEILNSEIAFNFQLDSLKKSTISLKSFSNINITPFDEKHIFTPKIFRLGNSIIPNTHGEYKFSFFEDEIIVKSVNDCFDHYLFFRFDNKLIKNEEIISEILTDNKLEIKSFDLNIDLNVGDNVVCADYSLPLKEITKIRTITGFCVENNCIIVQTIDQNNNPENIVYIDLNILSKNGEFTERVPIIKMGLIRKIICNNEIFTQGIKIRSKIKSIPVFPKKDVNEIVGIITDTGTKPIILCSNGHTLWCDDKTLSKFEFIDKKSKFYDKLKTDEFLKVVPKLQSGDIIGYPNDPNKIYNSGYYMTVDTSYPSVVLTKPLISLAYWGTAYNEKPRIQWIYKTIPMPRFHLDSEIIHNGVIPNYHGGYTLHDKSQFKISMEKI